MTTQLMNTGEPYFYKGGKTGCLLVHGFTATPKEVSYLAKHLAHEGHTVLGVRLSGHATNPSDMARSKFQDWLASVEDGYNLLKSSCDKIFIIGISMGGVLTLTFSSINEVDGIISMAAPYRLRNAPLWERLLIPIYKAVSKIAPYQKKGTPEWYRPERLKERISYDVNPTASAAELIKLLRVLRVQIPKIKKPTLIIHSIDDDYVVSENAELIFKALTTEDKEIFYVEEASHVITEDGDLEKLFSKISQFIQRVSEK